MTNPQTPEPQPANHWLGILGVCVVLGFAGLGVLDTSLHPTAADAHVPQAAEGEPVDPDAHHDASLATADTSLPLYINEAGSHTPSAPGTTPATTPGTTPGPEATSLFDSH